MGHHNRNHRRQAIIKYMLALLAAAFIVPGCSAQKVSTDEQLTFALIANTKAESPFKETNKKINAIFDQINRENPLLVVHLGDMIFGGMPWMGVNRADITRQFSRFYEALGHLRPLFYTVKGAHDSFNGSSDCYSLYTGKKPYYSFNCGAIHCIVLDSNDGGAATISNAQLHWLEKDLKRSAGARTIFVFLYHPVINGTKSTAEDGKAMVDGADRLHQLFKNYPVAAVFSAGVNAYFQESREGIRYINAGCAGLHESSNYQKNNNYYLVRYQNRELSLIPKKI